MAAAEARRAIVADGAATDATLERVPGAGRDLARLTAVIDAVCACDDATCAADAQAAELSAFDVAIDSDAEQARFATELRRLSRCLAEVTSAARPENPAIPE